VTEPQILNKENCTQFHNRISDRSKTAKMIFLDNESHLQALTVHLQQTANDVAIM